MSRRVLLGIAALNGVGFVVLLRYFGAVALEDEKFLGLLLIIPPMVTVLAIRRLWVTDELAAAKRDLVQAQLLARLRELAPPADSISGTRGTDSQ